MSFALYGAHECLGSDGVCWAGDTVLRSAADVYEPPNLVQNLFEVYMYICKGVCNY